MLELRNLKPGDLKAVVDTGNLSPGRHKLNVSVNLPPAASLVRIQPTPVTVWIEKSP